METLGYLQVADTDSLPQKQTPPPAPQAKPKANQRKPLEAAAGRNTSYALWDNPLTCTMF